MSRIIKIDTVSPDPAIFALAATLVRQGGLIAYPTDTYYGIAADPFNKKAVSRLFEAKRRALSKPILLLISEISQLHPLVDQVSPLAEKVINRFWPGPLTLIFQAAPGLSSSLTAGTGKIGVRFPAAQLPIALIQAVGFPLTATSANISGESAPVTSRGVAAMIGDELDLILAGDVCGTLPSTLLDLSDNSPRILRKGKLSTDSLITFFDDYGVNVACK